MTEVGYEPSGANQLEDSYVDDLRIIFEFG